MATYLFTDDADFKASLGKAINSSMKVGEMGPTMEIAYETHILPWLGDDQFGDLVDAVENNVFTAQQTALLPYAKRTLAHLTMYEYGKIGEIQVTDAGYHRHESENQKGAYKNQVNRYDGYMLNAGYMALERMITFLVNNSAGYPLWTAASQSARATEAFINTAGEFQLVYSTNVNRYVMETLRGVMLSIEQFAIVPVIGQPFFDELKTAIAAGSITADQLTVIDYIRRAVAAFTVEEGIRRNLVQNTGIAIVVNETLEPQGHTKQAVPSDQKLRVAIRHHDEFGNRWINVLKAFLDENRDTYTAYNTWLTGIEEAAAEEENTVNITEHDEVNTAHPTSTRKSVVRL